MKHYEDFVNTASFALFLWVRWLLKLGYKRPIEMRDLGTLPQVHQTKYNYQKLRKVFRREMVRFIIHNVQTDNLLLYFVSYSSKLFSWNERVFHVGVTFRDDFIFETFYVVPLSFLFPIISNSMPRPYRYYIVLPTLPPASPKKWKWYQEKNGVKTDDFSRTLPLSCLSSSICRCYNSAATVSLPKILL